MLAKKQPPPITTYQNFFKALRLCQDKYGLKFQFYSVGEAIWDDEGRAMPDTVRHRSGSFSLWNPVEVVHHVFYSPKPRLWVPGDLAYEAIGLSRKKYNELVLAYREARGHYVQLRDEMCDALGLEDIPIKERATYREMNNMHKRRR